MIKRTLLRGFIVPLAAEGTSLSNAAAEFISVYTSLGNSRRCFSPQHRGECSSYDMIFVPWLLGVENWSGTPEEILGHRPGQANQKGLELVISAGCRSARPFPAIDSHDLAAKNSQNLVHDLEFGGDRWNSDLRIEPVATRPRNQNPSDPQQAAWVLTLQIHKLADPGPTADHMLVKQRRRLERGRQLEHSLIGPSTHPQDLLLNARGRLPICTEWTRRIISIAGRRTIFPHNSKM